MSDWQTQPTVLSKRTTAKDRRSTSAVNKASRQGNVDVDKKYGAGGNQQKTCQKNTANLDRETEELKHEAVSKDFSRHLREARTAKGWTQKDMAQKINEKPQIIQEYETGKALPNNQIQSKMERVLGVHLRGKDAGKPLLPRGKKNKT
ncbi:hypothetical protein ACHWQZ_G002857 [Mnemiopsis leidyi]